MDESLNPYLEKKTDEINMFPIPTSLK